MAKKRRRTKKKRSESDEEFFGDEANRPLAKGQDFIDEHVIRIARSLGLRIKGSLFKDAGFRCTTCMWTTSKTGTNGRNAMRAHLKKHLNTRRARNRLKRYVYLGLLLVLSALALSFRSDLDIGVAWSLVEGVDWAVMAGPSLLAFSIAAVAGLGTFEYLFRKRPTKRWWLGFRVSVVCALAVLASEVVLASGAAQVHVDWPWLLSGLLPTLALLGTLPDFGLTALRVSRRQLKPRSYIRRFKSITAVGDEQIYDVQWEISLRISKGEFDVRKLKKWQAQALITLGILKVEE